MKISRIIVIVVGVLLLSGCGDQMYCGDDGCNHSSKMTSPFNG